MYKSSLRSTTVQTRSQNPSCLCQIKKPQRTDPSIPQPSYPHSIQKIQGKRHVASVSRPSTCRITGHTPPGKASHIILSKSRDLASSTITSTVCCGSLPRLYPELHFPPLQRQGVLHWTELQFPKSSQKGRIKTNSTGAMAI